MRNKTLTKLAWKNLWAHRLRALLTVGGVTIGISSILFLVSLGFGLERLVTHQVADFQAFMIIDVPSANLKTGKINIEAINRLRSIGHITKINEVVDLAGRVRLANQNATTETLVVGATPDYFQIAGIPISSGKLYATDSKDQIVVNEGLAKLLGFPDPKKAIGQQFVTDLIISKDVRADDATDGPIVKEGINLTVVGIVTDSSNPIIYIPLGLAQDVGAINRSSLKVQVDGKQSIPVVRKAIENIGFSTEYVGDTIEEISQVFTLSRIILGGFGAIALFVAAMGTFNTLTIALIERIREIGLLKTFGMTRKDIFKLFIIESTIICTLGGILGIMLGNAAGWALNTFLAYLAQRVNADPITVYYAPSYFMLLIGVSGIGVGVLIGLYPARRAVKIQPLDVLRYE